MINKIPEKYNEGLKRLLGIVAVASIISAAFLFIGFTEKREIITKETGHLFWKHTTKKIVNHPLSERIVFLIGAVLLIVMAVFCLILIVKIIIKQNRQKRYITIFKGNEEISVKKLANIMGIETQIVLEDVQNLISSGTLSGFYINFKNNSVVNTNFIPKNIKKSVVTCGSCGKRNELIIGVPKKCVSCMEPLITNI